MGIPTWRNVEGPDYSAANKMMEQGNARQAEAFVTGRGVIDDWSDVKRDRGTGEALAQISQLNDIEGFDQQRAALLSGLNMGNVDQRDVMSALGDQRDTLDTRDQYAFERQHRDELMAMEKSALSARIGASNRSGRGGGGGGGGNGAGGGKFEATPFDRVLDKVIKDNPGKSDNELESIFHQQVADLGGNSQQGGFSWKNRMANSQKRSNEKKTYTSGVQSGVLKDQIGQVQSPRYSLMPDSWYAEDVQKISTNMQSLGVKNDDISKLIRDTSDDRGVQDFYKFKKGADLLERKARIEAGK